MSTIATKTMAGLALLHPSGARHACLPLRAGLFLAGYVDGGCSLYVYCRRADRAVILRHASQICFMSHWASLFGKSEAELARIFAPHRGDNLFYAISATAWAAATRAGSIAPAWLGVDTEGRPVATPAARLVLQ